MIPEDLRYSKEHEWVRVKNGVAEIGITHFAQDQLGDIVYVELPEAGKKLDRDGTFGVVESVKTVSDLFAPVSGEVVEVNPNLLESGDSFQPELINNDPYGEGWMLRIKIADTAQLDDLLDHSAYAEHVEGEEA